MALTALDPRTALVLIDLQNAIVNYPTVPYSGPEVVARAVELADIFRGYGLPVVLVHVTNRSDGSDSAHGRTEVHPPTIKLPPGWDSIVAELSGHPEDIIVTKRNWGAFYGTDLDLELRRRNITQIVLGGLTTSAGVDTTARGAYERNYNVTLVTDAMADLSLSVHESTIEGIFPALGERGTTAEIIELLTKTWS